ncbi:hypothetical protein SIM91_04895 [Rhodococcus opacus]|jgi:hypothetical protein|uniref:Conjugal transfer protein TrbC n=1 Tax=Rhodococcus opacus TaxID=37919 RepID=A0AAX3YPB6_RHOOP|nr:hypothetical protein [Rhodococcus opacus]ELB94729.1 hypothetical protein Rwratislav_02387 [Rhodococcus wratislaviensis IFP 2016]MCZ4587687.1 hypothetical protein [Rhodococcus opacus]MDX5962660.1 hypothetical protein [Rhodococcus opacus]WLF51317.1 hypothetical protein Q5707_38805 [Rhodococcus opacus]CAG7636157.1 hypothetical protein E143388_07764 [Rhodococcus opacus]
MWVQVLALTGDPSTTVVAQEGWDSVEGIIDSVRDKLLLIGGTLLTVFGSILAIKIGASGKGKMRERIGDVGIWVFAGVFAGLVTFIPGLATSLGTETAQSGTNGDGVSVVDGQ